ncbi:MAG: hypothetical protein WCC66_08200 [Rhizobiaceae bacterium]
MDWALAITRNRDQLRQIVLALFALAKMRVGGSLFTLPRVTFAAIMLVLRPAESAVRRLIVIAAHGLVLKPRPARMAPEGLGPSPLPFKIRAFPLFDPLKSFDPEAVWDTGLPHFESDLAPDRWQGALLDDKPVNAALIGQRLNALMRALEDLPRQARRLARWQEKRDAALKAGRPTRISPLRPGLPPGWRQRGVHEIDDVLRECHGLANDRLDSS